MSVPQERIGRRTNLDEFLDNLFSKKIEFQVEQSFIRCLQTTLENYVKDLFVELKKLPEVQAKVKKLKRYCDGYFYETAHCNHVLPVGSFYDGTKNTFPDEFDYLLVLLTAQRLIYVKDDDHIIFTHQRNNGLLFNFIDDFAHHVKDLTDYIIKIDTNQFFDLEFTSLKRIGPACKLCFTLKKKLPSIFEGDSIKIHVDITPAIKVIDCFLPKYVETICSVEGFRNEIVKTGSYFVVQQKHFENGNEETSNFVTFTAHEVLFLKNSMSTRHKRAYRLLKYLINGEMEEDQLFDMGLYPGSFSIIFKISSYVLKTLMINHHYSCENDIFTESHCVIDVLKTIQSYKKKKNKVIIPLLHPGVEKEICHGKSVVQHFMEELSGLISTLESLSETSENVLHETTIIPISKRMYNNCVSDLRKRARKRARMYDRCKQRFELCSSGTCYMLFLCWVGYIIILCSHNTD